MKCLSVCQPWATLLVYGVKPIENRDWYTSHRGPLVIQASKSLDYFTEQTVAEIAAVWPSFPKNRVAAINKLQHTLGMLLGVIDVTDCVLLHRARALGYTQPRHFAEGPHCIIHDVTRAVRFKCVVPFRGQQGIFNVPENKVHLHEANLIRYGEKYPPG